MQHRLMAVLAADAVGYSSLMARDDMGTVATLNAARRVFRSHIESHHGRVIDMAGDSVLAVFDTVVGAVNAALMIQKQLAVPDDSDRSDKCMQFRIGLHMGDLISGADGAVYGDGVNIAARLQALAEPGGITVSHAVRSAVLNRIEVVFDDLGEQRVKNIAQPVHVFSVRIGEQPTTAALQGPTTPNNLPGEYSRFIGRRKDLVTCEQLLAGTRLLTLTGIGGCGKTRLALKLARQLMGEYPDGVWFVDLAPLQDAQRVLITTTMAVGVTEQPGTPLVERLVEHLSTQRALIVLDNCEHVIEAVRAQAELLLAKCGLLKIIATSRESLGLTGEQVWAVRSLSLPESADSSSIEQSEAVQLFVDRARQVNLHFGMQPGTAAVVAEICRRLDGIALALELAAARTKVLSLEQIRDKLGDRFRLLTGGNRGVPRQQTLLTVIQWSYDNLNAQEQLQLRQLCIFSAGATLQAATAIAGEPADEYEVLNKIASLVDKSLLEVTRQDSATPRYRMLETVRQYAQERLNEAGEGDELRTRHLGFYLALAQEAEPKLESSETAAWLAQLDLERENFLSALAWCDDAPGGARAGLELVVAIRFYWLIRGPFELGYGLTVQALARAGAQEHSPIRCRALEAAGTLGGVMLHRYREGQQYLEEGLAIAHEISDATRVSATRKELGDIAMFQEDWDAARTHYHEAISLARGLADKQLLYRPLCNLGELERATGNPVAAQPLYEEFLALGGELGDRHMISTALINLAAVSVGQEAWPQASQLLLEAVSIVEELGAKRQGVLALCVAAGLAVLVRQLTHAVRFDAAAQSHETVLGLHREPADEAFLAPLITQARQALGEADFAAAQATGQTLSLEAAVGELRQWLESLQCS